MSINGLFVQLMSPAEHMPQTHLESSVISIPAFKFFAVVQSVIRRRDSVIERVHLGDLARNHGRDVVADWQRSGIRGSRSSTASLGLCPALAAMVVVKARRLIYWRVYMGCNHSRITQQMWNEFHNPAIRPYHTATNALPVGTYIATGLSGVTQLAAYLDANPDTKITRLLLSDSTIQDLETEAHPTDWETILNFNRAVSDIAVPLQRILDKAAPSLEALCYLAYMNYTRIDELGDDARIMALLWRSYPSLTQLTFRDNRMHGTHSHTCTPESLPAYFPHLTHLRSTGANKLPEELRLCLGLLKQAILNIPPLSIPENLTVTIDSGLGSSAFYGTRGVDYDDVTQLLLDSSRVHFRLFPAEEDYLPVAYLRRAITEFAERAWGRGGVDCSGACTRSVVVEHGLEGRRKRWEQTVI
ncbi:hypothetical protein C8R44DRAFT_724360 [Mycena epipterygia]|nr:hypothetical protein C8R44DRAFT_724360 [Mycena epipterygia]